MNHCGENSLSCCQSDSRVDGCVSFLSSAVLVGKCRAHPQSVSLTLRVGDRCLELRHRTTHSQSAPRAASNHNLMFTLHRPWHFNSLLVINSQLCSKTGPDRRRILICYLLSVQCCSTSTVLLQLTHYYCQMKMSHFQKYLFSRIYDQSTI